MIVLAVLAVAIESSPFAAVIASVLTGGIVFALVAFRKAPSEIEATSVETMQVVNKTLREELTRLSEENKQLRERLAIAEGR